MPDFSVDINNLLNDNNRNVENVKMDQEIEMDAENMVSFARSIGHILGEFRQELLYQGFDEEVTRQLVYSFFSLLVMDGGDIPQGEDTAQPPAE